MITTQSSTRASSRLIRSLTSRTFIGSHRLNSSSATTSSENSAVEPPPAGGHLPSIAQSAFLKGTRDQALKTPGIAWADAELDEVRGTVSNNRETRKMNTYQAVRDALSIALSTDDSAIIFGEDVAFGGVFRCTLGLAEEYGRERVFNTPATEQGIVGFGIGYASMGSAERSDRMGAEQMVESGSRGLNMTTNGTGRGGTAIAEVQFADYIWPAFDQIINEASKFRYRSGGNFNIGGLTIRTPTMAVGHGALYHSQSPEGFFMGGSGLKVVIPRSPIQAKGLLLASIRDPNPVIFMEPKVLYRSAVEQVPIADYTLPLSSAETLQSGSDLTIVTYGTSVYLCEQALQLFNHPPEGSSIARAVGDAVGDWKKAKSLSSRKSSSDAKPTIHLIDLRTILPYDLPYILESVSKTGRLLIVHEGPLTGGVGAQISAEVMKRNFLELEAPVKIVGGWDLPGVALQYEKFYIPDAVRILDGMLETLAY
ncbi:hypothetical protein GYMLUDRAFT_45509 [Collybiopsis luxurians FD-317 M1]|uniref:3-methyl-2-oxobutanoate dehydrogenase (2-methylpropanoyl-transferring) n=1 Tax=Collybiopsis luxurians FD-317 M1 TaxID=944289 RepID=A0A0D0CIZ6_9AGAR|nr:hypothetical protein GYMLUDRAFT_45509 [Collybiopsis luxurians FD-317 M1]